jgi:hypothetical protein
MEHNGIVKAGVATHHAPLHRRFLHKMVIDVLPAALTSVVGGFLVTQYQFSHSAALHPVAEQAAPASGEMIKLVRDEHGVIMDYLTAQIAAEKARNSAADAAGARAVTDAKLAADKAAADKLAAEVLAVTSANSMPAANSTAANSMPAVVVTAKASTPRKAPTGAVAAPPVVAQAMPAAAPVPSPAAPPQQSKSLLAKTLDIKDHVVAATSHAAWTAVSAIGSLPSWIASMGDHGGETTTAPNSGGQSFAS